MVEAHDPGLAVEIAIAPYFGHVSDIQDIDKPGATADALFERINAKIDSEIGPGSRHHAALASRFGVPLVSYEGGNHLTAMDGMNEKLKRMLQNEPRMGKTMTPARCLAREQRRIVRALWALGRRGGLGRGACWRARRSAGA